MAPRFQGRPVNGPRFGGSRIAYFDTAQGPASQTVQSDGTVWLELEDGRSGALASFEGARPVYAGRGGQPQQGDGSAVGPRQRTLRERFTTTVSDQAMRNPLQALARYALPSTASTHTDPKTGQTFQYNSLGRDMRQDERARRDSYEANLEGDRWRQAPGGLRDKAAAGVATLGGAFVGGASDPINAIGGFGRTILTRILAEAGVNAAGDVVTQAADVGAGIERRYDPKQTLAAAAIGATIQGSFEGAGPAARAVTDGARRTARFTGRKISETGARLDAAIANPVPAFDGRSVETGPVLRPMPPRPRPVPPVTRSRPERAARAAAPVQAAIDNAARTAGVSRDYMTALAQRESSFNPTAKADTSSATGLFQFTDRTWLNTLKKHGERLGMPDAAARIEANPGAVLAMRNDADLNARAAAALTQDNAAALRGVLKREPTNGELYSAHFLGEAGARRLATSDPRASAAEIFPDAAGANRSIFFDGDRARSVAEVQTNFAQSFGSGSPSRGQAVAEPELWRSASQPRAVAGAEPVGIARPLGRPGPTPEALAQAFGAQPSLAAHPGASIAKGGEPATRAAPASSAAPVGLPLDLRTRQAPLDPLEAFGSPRGLTIPRPELPPAVTRVAPTDNVLSPNLPGFRVEVPGAASTILGGAVMGDIRPDLTWRVRAAELPENLRGEGRAVGAYAMAARDAAAAGGRLTSDAEVSPSAARVWEGLERRGFAVERNPLAVEVSRAGLPDTMGMGPVSLRTPDDSPVFSISRTPDAPASGPRFSGRRITEGGAAPQPRFTGRPVEAGAPTGRLAMMAGDAAPDRLAIDLSGYGQRISNPTLPTSGQNIGGLRQAPRPGAVARGAGDGGYAGQTVSALADDLRNALGVTHRQGRLTMKRAEGEYDTGSAVVRTKSVQELDVLAHEATHALEYQRNNPTLQAARRAHAKELETMAYPGAGPGVTRQEGFAEFGRWYLTNPEYARQAAPSFYQAFERALEQDAPQVATKLRDIQGAYQQLLRADSIEVAKASLAYTGSKGPIRDMFREMKDRGPGSVVRRMAHRAYTALLDDKHPIAQAVQELEKLYLQNSGKRASLRPSQNPYTLARLTPDAHAAGLNDVLHGVTPYRGLDPEGPALADVLDMAGLKTNRAGSFAVDALREFDAYLIARRMVHEWDRFSRGDLPRPPDRNTRAFHEQVIADAEAAHPTWSGAASRAYEWLNNLWRKEFEAGLITRESYERGMTEHPDYVPLMRDMTDKGPSGRAGKPRGALQYAGGVKAFEGSTRDIISPLSSMMRRAYELNAIIKRNEVMIALDDLAENAGPGSGAIVERLPAREIEAVSVNAAEALRRTADELGLSGRDLSTLEKLADDADGSTVTLFRPTEFSPRKGEAVVFVWRDGKKTPLLLPDGEFGQAMFNALTGLNKELRNVVVDVAAAGTQLLRYGVTLSPEFMGANLVRDALATWINSGTGFVPVLDTVRGGVEALRGGRDAIRYGSAGGMRGGGNVAALSRAVPRTDQEAQLQLQALQKKGFRIRRMATNPMRALAEATDLSETATRLGVFKRGFDEAKKQGLDDYDALIQSTFLTRDYMDFGRRGSKMMAAARIVTFLNAALQGLDKTARVLSADGSLKTLLKPLTRQPATPAERMAYNHAYKAWAKVATLGALGLGLRMLYADDPEYQEIGDQLRATHWVFRAGGQWVFVPKPFELATLSNIMERAYEGTVLKDPTAGERLLSDMSHTIAPPSEIPSLAVPFQIGKNRDHLGRPIVPDHLRGTVEPSLQFNGYTSDLGKLIGKTFNVSPAVVDHVVTGFGGSLGRYVLQGSNLVGEAVIGRPRTAAGLEDMFLARRFVRKIARGATSQKEFWDQVSRDGGDMTRAEGSYRSLTREGKDAEAVAYLNRLPAERRAFVAAKTMMPEGMSIVHPLIRAERAVSVMSDFRRDVRNGDLRGMNGEVVALTPEDRRVIDGALADFALAEMRNALTATGIKGWEQRQPLDAAAAADRVRRASPQAYEQLWTRLALEKAPTAIWPEANEQMRGAWTQYRPMLEGKQDAAQLVPFMRQRRLKNGDRGARFQEMQRMMADERIGQ